MFLAWKKKLKKDTTWKGYRLRPARVLVGFNTLGVKRRDWQVMRVKWLGALVAAWIQGRNAGRFLRSWHGRQGRILDGAPCPWKFCLKPVYAYAQKCKEESSCCYSAPIYMQFSGKTCMTPGPIPSIRATSVDCSLQNWSRHKIRHDLITNWFLEHPNWNMQKPTDTWIRSCIKSHMPTNTIYADGMGTQFSMTFHHQLFVFHE